MNLDELDHSVQPGRPSAQAWTCWKLCGESASEVLETMFFSEALPADCEHAWLATACIGGRGFLRIARRQDAGGGVEDAADSIASGFWGWIPR